MKRKITFLLFLFTAQFFNGIRLIQSWDNFSDPSLTRAKNKKGLKREQITLEGVRV